jgi:hypothetical protein
MTRLLQARIHGCNRQSRRRVLRPAARVYLRASRLRMPVSLRVSTRSQRTFMNHAGEEPVRHWPFYCGNDLRPSASCSARKNPQCIQANTPPVFPGLQPRIWPYLVRLVTKAMSDRLLGCIGLSLSAAYASTRWSRWARCKWNSYYCRARPGRTIPHNPHDS